MQSKEILADIRYIPSIEMYHVTLMDFDVATENGKVKPAFYILPENMPDRFKDEEQKFKIGDLVDRVYHPRHGNYFHGPEKQHREFVGEITSIKEKVPEMGRPRQFLYTVKGAPHNTRDYEQWELQLSLNPAVD